MSATSLSSPFAAVPQHGFTPRFEFWAMEVAVPALRRLCLLLERADIETGYDHLRGKSVRFYVRYTDAREQRALASLVFTPEPETARVAVHSDLGEAVHLKTVDELDADTLAEMAAALSASAAARRQARS
ncbi:MAG TPA: hypothetical protein VGN52_04110 [Burkholderiales bacterium]